LLSNRNFCLCEEVIEQAEKAAGENAVLREKVACRRTILIALRNGKLECKYHKGVDYVLIPPGEFKMGQPGSSKTVKISYAFWISCSPITIGQYKQFRRPFKVISLNHPITNVSWNIARQYCQSVGGRLPNEHEWEYVARSGLEDCNYPWGNRQDQRLAHYKGAGTIAIKQYPQNLFGVWDIVGNVWEWCEELYLPKQNLRVVRGGSFQSSAEACQVWVREGRHSDRGWDDVGFRCVLSI
jgi:formylglycine-generating enzyme required for sulfatase activity